LGSNDAKLICADRGVVIGKVVGASIR